MPTLAHVLANKYKHWASWWALGFVVGPIVVSLVFTLESGMACRGLGELASLGAHLTLRVTLEGNQGSRGLPPTAGFPASGSCVLAFLLISGSGLSNRLSSQSSRVTTSGPNLYPGT